MRLKEFLEKPTIDVDQIFKETEDYASLLREQYEQLKKEGKITVSFAEYFKQKVAKKWGI